MSIVITETKEEALLIRCAEMMCSTEPWITLERNFSDCLASTQGDFKEIYIATESNELMGFIILQMAGTFKGYIQSICVAKEARGKGIGTQLIQFAEDRIHKISPNVFMCVSHFNASAIKLYERLGFEKIGILKDFIKTGHSEILLRKTIGSLSDFKKAHP
jgi:ribosomal protein S18 acetylase RimI-like enzyme